MALRSRAPSLVEQKANGQGVFSSISKPWFSDGLVPKALAGLRDGRGVREYGSLEQAAGTVGRGGAAA